MTEAAIDVPGLTGTTYALVNLGCKVNRVESDGFERLLQRTGFRPVEDGVPASLVVVNTCTVTGEAEKKTRKAVRQALRSHPGALVMVTGCAAAISPEVFSLMDGRVQVVPKAEADLFLGKLSAVSGHKAASAVAPAEGLARAFDGPAELSRTRRGVKVQDGCNNACTYCIVHVARGKATSRPADEVLRDSLALAEGGAGEVVLSGINLGSYDWEGMKLADLLLRLLAATEGQAVRFRISSIEPMDVDDALVELLAASGGRVCRHLHLPLQSGSSKVLGEMERPYCADEFLHLVERLYRACPTLSLSTDIIAGFPGETEAEFQETLEMARACRFSKIHAFPYSQREGTPAAVRADQVAPEVKTARARQLRQLAVQLRREDFARRIGTEELAVVEEPGRACTESYYEIPAPQGLTPGELVKTTIPATFLA